MRKKLVIPRGMQVLPVIDGDTPVRVKGINGKSITIGYLNKWGNWSYNTTNCIMDDFRLNIKATKQDAINELNKRIKNVILLDTPNYVMHYQLNQNVQYPKLGIGCEFRTIKQWLRMTIAYAWDQFGLEEYEYKIHIDFVKQIQEILINNNLK